jgi:hypothetical protein
LDFNIEGIVLVHFFLFIPCHHVEDHIVSFFVVEQMMEGWKIEHATR